MLGSNVHMGENEDIGLASKELEGHLTAHKQAVHQSRGYEPAKSMHEWYTVRNTANGHDAAGQINGPPQADAQRNDTQSFYVNEHVGVTHSHEADLNQKQKHAENMSLQMKQWESMSPKKKRATTARVTPGYMKQTEVSTIRKTKVLERY